LDGDKAMKIEAFIIMFNESEILPLVIRHYKKFCDHITFFDNYSTDSSQLIAESMDCDVKKFGKPGVLDDQAYLDVKNHCWKGIDADWVIIVDCDEIVATNRGDLYGEIGRSTIFETIGWNVYSNEMPKESLSEITTGYQFDNYSKTVIFNPKEIKEINYKPGAHDCNPIGNIIYANESDIPYLLHYKHIGGVERLLKRNREYMKRMSANNKRKGWGCHYWQPEAQTRREFAERLAISKPLI